VYAARWGYNNSVLSSWRTSFPRETLSIMLRPNKTWGHTLYFMWTMLIYVHRFVYTSFLYISRLYVNIFVCKYFYFTGARIILYLPCLTIATFPFVPLHRTAFVFGGPAGDGPGASGPRQLGRAQRGRAGQAAGEENLAQGRLPGLVSGVKNVLISACVLECVYL